MRSRVSWMAIQQFTVVLFQLPRSLKRVCRIPPPSIAHRGTPIARVCRAQTLAALPVNPDGIHQAHVFAQFGFITEARRFIPAALYLLPAGAQPLLPAPGNFLSLADPVTSALMMKAWRLDA